MRLRSLLYQRTQIITIIGFFVLYVLVSTALAQGSISNPIQANTFGELVQAIAKAITAIGIPLVAIFLVWSGFLFVTARGNEQQLERAKNTFFWAVVGGAVVIGAWAIAVAIVNFARSLG